MEDEEERHQLAIKERDQQGEGQRLLVQQLKQREEERQARAVTLQQQVQQENRELESEVERLRVTLAREGRRRSLGFQEPTSAGAAPRLQDNFIKQLQALFGLASVSKTLHAVDYPLLFNKVY